MKDTLSIIQMISKIARILTKVLMVLSIVGGAFCLAGVIALAIGAGESFVIFGIPINSLIEKEAEMSIGDMTASMVVGLIMMAGFAVKLGFATRYFKNELDEGTPFTFEGAKEMLHLGIILMAVSLASETISGIALAIMNAAAESEFTSDLSNSNGILVGAIFLAMSFILKYGAEKSGSKEIAEK